MNTYKKAYADIYYILNALEEEYRNKVHDKLIEFFRENADQYYVPKIDITKKLIDQNISEETEQLICLLNLNYWCTPKEKDELLKRYEINEQILQEQYRIKFKENNKIEDIKDVIIIEKESIFAKIIKFLKSIIAKKT